MKVFISMAEGAGHFSGGSTNRLKKIDRVQYQFLFLVAGNAHQKVLLQKISEERHGW